MKKVLSLVLVLTLVLGSLTAFAATDDLTGHANEAAVRRLITLGLVKGDAGGYRPNDTITRAEFAAMVVRVLGKETVAEISKGQTVFTDVPATHWASGYIKVASTLGIIKGRGDGNFDPAGNISYQEALTIVNRALGYEALAEQKGGYPIGHLLVADDLGLTNKADGVAGLAASRGLVFQVLDNALTKDMMVQTSVGDKATWEVKEGKTLLGELGYKAVTRRVVDFDSTRARISLKADKETLVLKVAKDFDFEAVYGLNIRAWYDGNDNLVIFEVKDTPMFDAVKNDGAKEKLGLISADKKYDIAKGATLVVDGKSKDADEDFTADYAKIVLNDEDEVIWAVGYTFDDVLVVEEVKDKIVYSFNDDELDLAKYDIFKNGKTISIDDLEEVDLLFFNRDQKVAVVHNDSKIGELERVYSTEFRLGGKTYDIQPAKYEAKYLDGNKLGKLDSDALDAMKDEGEVEVFFALDGSVVLVMGDRGIAPTNSFYGLVANDSVKYNGRQGTMWSLDVLNNEGKVVSYDLTNAFVTSAKYVGDSWITDANNDDKSDNITKDTLVRVTLNTNGVPTKVERLNANPLKKNATDAAPFKVDATYARAEVGGNYVDYRLQPSTLVFVKDSTGTVSKYSVMTLENAAKEFTEVKTGSIYAENGRVQVVIADTTNANSKVVNYTGLVKKLRTVTSDKFEITIEVFGETKTFLSDTDKDINNATITAGNFYTIEVGDKTDRVSKVTPVSYDVQLTVKSRSTADKTITSTTTVVGTVYAEYELNSKAVVYNKDSAGKFTVINLRDLNAGDTVQLYRDGSSDRFVNYAVRTVKAPEAGGGGGGVIGQATVYAEYTHKTATITLKVNGELKVYNIVDTSLIEKADGSFLADSQKIAKDAQINFVLVEGTNNIGYIKVLQ